MIVNIHEAKTHLSRLVDRAAAGEEIIIGKSGQPRARLIAYSEQAEPRRSGALRGRLWVSDDFDEPTESLLDSFEGAG
ncbi:MAG: type II toxin-antitoxin system prevent-host-death family antitoxin [Actinomycetota bacterium]|nr:type II toxin-antitoxin system Phd/YefM family antitoxin [Geodermatophilaceae bacterium]MDQ3504847.1 type II toxin-antitoxin system prevent-host-death family antitoxin [Actinomycetota bacterium]